MHVKLSERVIERTQPNPTRRVYLWDTTTAGLGLIVRPSGRKDFVVDYRLASGRRERVAIGSWPAWPLARARRRALEIMAAGDRGESTAQQRRDARRALTWKQWVLEHYLPAVRLRKKRPDHDQYYLACTKGRGERQSEPSTTMQRWGTLKLAEITPARVENLLQHYAQRGKVYANRWLAAVRACLEAACREGHIETNPARLVKPLPPNPPRDRVLSDDEMARFIEAVDRLADPYARTFFHVLIETGCRSSEALKMRWEDVNLETGVWTLRSPKAGRVQHQPIPGPTVRGLAALPRHTAAPWVFLGRDPAKPRASFRDAWRKLVEEAKLEGVTVHDLRRSFGLRVAKLAGLHIASRLLRHSDVRITANVYAPLGLDDLRPAAEKAAKVLPMPAKRKARG